MEEESNLLEDSDVESTYSGSSLSDILSENDSISNINRVLQTCGLSERITRLSDCTVSMFVVLLEALFQIRLAGVNRYPKKVEDHLSNCEILMKTLSSEILESDLTHIKPLEICEGKKLAIMNLIELFVEITTIVMNKANSVPDEPEPIESDSDTDLSSSDESSVTDSLEDDSYSTNSLDTNSLLSSSSNKTSISNSTLSDSALVSPIPIKKMKSTPNKSITSDIRSETAEKLISSLNSVTPIKSPMRSSMLSQTPPRFKSPSKGNDKEWTGKSSTTPKGESQTQTMHSNLQPTSAQKETIKRHIQSIESLKKRSKKKIESTEEFIEHKQFDWISRFSKELEHLLNYHPDFQYATSELDDTDLFIDEAFKKLCKHIPRHLSKSVWEKPLKRFLKLKLSEHNKNQILKVKCKRSEDKISRHQMILDGVFSDLQAADRKKALQDKKVKNLALKSHLREQKATRAKMRAFLKQEAREKLSKTIRRQQADEKLYNNLFESALRIQKEAIREERRVIQERNEWLRKHAENKQEEVEKYYLDQFRMINEKLAIEGKERDIQQKAERDALRKLERDLKKVMQEQVTRLKERLQSEEDKTSFLLANQQREILDLVPPRSIFYQPSNYFDSRNN